MACSHEDVDEVFILLDLDDGCAKDFQVEFRTRAERAAGPSGTKVRLCFCVREFEGWFLANIGDLRAGLPEHLIDDGVSYPNAEAIRGAKELLCRACSGRKYRPMRDQNAFVKKLNVLNFFATSRSFRKFVKEATELSYESIAEACEKAF